MSVKAEVGCVEAGASLLGLNTALPGCCGLAKKNPPLGGAEEPLVAEGGGPAGVVERPLNENGVLLEAGVLKPADMFPGWVDAKFPKGDPLPLLLCAPPIAGEVDDMLELNMEGEG